ncbi:MAG TPA: FlgD immunoglobulin-like domain containing protein [bacterium]
MSLILILLQVLGTGPQSPWFPGITGTGGPDAYGYRWIDSDTTGGPAYGWINIKGIGTEITGLADDNTAGPFSVGFDLPYYWYTVNSFFVGSNGYIAFGDNTLEAHPFQTFPSPTGPNNTLAPLMADLDHSVGNATCWYWTNAAQDTCIVQYDSVQFWNVGTSCNTFEIIMSRADSAILFQYQTQNGTAPGGGNNLTVGIENVSGTLGLQYLHDNVPAGNALHSMLAIRFYPPTSTSYQVHDIAVWSMMNDVSGGFFVYNNDPVDFWGEIKNTGNQTEAAFNVFCQVRNSGNTVIYADTINVASLAPGAVDTLQFTPTFSTTTDGVYRLRVKSLLTGDMTPSNDSLITEFRVVTYPVQLQHDRNVVDAGYAWNGINSGYGAEFTPPRYPTKINTANFYVAQQTSNPPVHVQIIDDDGSNGDPGTILFDSLVTVYDSGWYNIDLAPYNLQVTSGTFYIGCISEYASDPYMGMDTIGVANKRTWEYTGSWAPYRDGQRQDVMIRAMVDFGTGVAELTPKAGDNGVRIYAQPNPFNRITAITCLPNTRTLKIYDAAGRMVRRVDNLGSSEYSWDGCNDRGVKLSPGIYFGVTNNQEILKLIIAR